MNSSKTNFIKASFCLFAAFSVAGCVDLSGAKYHPAKKKHPMQTNATGKKVAHTKNAQLYRGEVHTMLGGLGVFSTGMQELSDSVEATYHIPAPSGMWYNAGLVSRTLISNHYKDKNPKPIVLVGHSLGANEQIKVARNLNKAGVPVDLLVTVDAVSQTVVPPNVKHAMNFYKTGYVPMFSGLRLRAVDPGKTQIDNIDVTRIKGVNVNHFTIDKHPVVQAMIMEEVKKVTSNANRAKA
ncbi:MAG: hypothetical protein LEGION0403_FIIPPAGN_00337 [Legionella sp.]|uniref:hypothetical protein n=1 Tax=Legionella sp. TaxID=459 RepID=UPI003D09852E